jgi:hypothetical protein
VPYITLLYRDANSPCPYTAAPITGHQIHSVLTMHSLNHTTKQTCHYTAPPPSAIRQTCHYPLIITPSYRPCHYTCTPLIKPLHRPCHHPHSHNHAITVTTLARSHTGHQTVIIPHSPNQATRQSLFRIPPIRTPDRPCHCSTPLVRPSDKPVINRPTLIRPADRQSLFRTPLIRQPDKHCHTALP